MALIFYQILSTNKYCFKEMHLHSGYWFTALFKKL